MEVDILAACRAERPKALGRRLAANGAGFCNVGRFRHAVQISPASRPRKAEMQGPHAGPSSALERLQGTWRKADAIAASWRGGRRMRDRRGGADAEHRAVEQGS